jgi:hypothetical protein
LSDPQQIAVREEEEESDKWVPSKIYKDTPNSLVCLIFDLSTSTLCHVSTDSGVYLSEIVLTQLKARISTHCNEFSQNRWFFAILPNSGGFKYFPHKCGGFLELTLKTKGISVYRAVFEP